FTYMDEYGDHTPIPDSAIEEYIAPTASNNYTFKLVVSNLTKKQNATFLKYNSTIDKLPSGTEIPFYAEGYGIKNGNELSFQTLADMLLVVNPWNQVVAKYVDEAGNSIAADEMIEASVGEAYQTEQKVITGYTFKELAAGSAPEM